MGLGRRRFIVYDRFSSARPKASWISCAVRNGNKFERYSAATGGTIGFLRCKGPRGYQVDRFPDPGEADHSSMQRHNGGLEARDHRGVTATFMTGLAFLAACSCCSFPQQAHPLCATLDWSSATSRSGESAFGRRCQARLLEVKSMIEARYSVRSSPGGVAGLLNRILLFVGNSLPSALVAQRQSVHAPCHRDHARYHRNGFAKSSNARRVPLARRSSPGVTPRVLNVDASAPSVSRVSLLSTPRSRRPRGAAAMPRPAARLGVTVALSRPDESPN